MSFEEGGHFIFLPVILGITVNTSNVHGTSQTQQGMSAIQRAMSTLCLYSTKVGFVAFNTYLFCINIP